MELLDFGLVALAGLLVAVAELTSRYPDAPGRALRTWPAGFYILINIGATAGALAALKAFDVRFGTAPENIRWARDVVAGFGAIAFFRSAFFIGRSNAGRGPLRMLQALLGASDRAIDRQRAEQRADVVRDIAAGLSFADVRDALPTYCIALMSNATDAEQEGLVTQVTALDAADMPDTTKVEALALSLMDLVGEDTLRAAVSNVRAAHDDEAGADS